jgi:CTP:molybdopterin cytidylyltransferase MocA
MTATAGLLLAAGAGTRLGGPKALIGMEGRTLVERGVDLLRAGGCDPVLVVLGAAADRIRPLVEAEVAVADEWREGMGASLRAGLQALLATDATACVVALVDQPLIGAEAVRRLIRAGGSAAAASYDGALRNPVLLAREVWADVASLAVGDVGARAWLRANPSRVTAVPCGDTGRPDDVDTAEDLERICGAGDENRTRVLSLGS